jgi:F420 biosynthesis protein FbiB-like protein
MSDFIGALKQRRSIRIYELRAIPDEDLTEILDAAVWAPSAHNAQPWRFIALKEDKDKCALAEAMGETWLRELQKDGVPKAAREDSVRASVERFASAPVLILACVTLEDMNAYPDEGRRKSERDLAVQSLGAAVENLLLAAHAKGLGGCWYCAPAFCQAAVRQALGIPEDVEPQALITLGYPAEEPKAPCRLPLGDVVFVGRWGGDF